MNKTFNQIYKYKWENIIQKKIFYDCQQIYIVYFSDFQIDIMKNLNKKQLKIKDL